MRTRKMFRLICSLVVLLLFCNGYAQKAPINWYLKSPKGDGIYGTAIEKAYQLLKDRKPQEVIVAVIDSGVEVDHEDLKEVIWVNEDEQPGNGIDDDKNGYVDDVHGWSFLGGASEDINYESMEIARMYHAARKYFADKDVSNLNAEDKAYFAKYRALKVDFDAEQSTLLGQYEGISMLAEYIANVKAASNGEFSKKSNKSYVPQDEMEERIKKRMKLILAFMKAEELDQEVMGGADQIGNLIKYNEINTDSIRALIVGDNVSNSSEQYYGCNRYEGPDAMHGTHVAGIIAAKRGNGIGIDGIAANARIMVLRAVPNGDERDKDVANAIRYAVDNGAKVINMSFGKYYTPDKGVVDEAIQYAKSKDVLLVHAAGNDSKNKDKEDSYPTRLLSDGTTASNWIEVGASSSSRRGKKLLADFSNYGSKTVDLFAPGVDIFSTVPDNKYEDASGTSMACPATAGVCAMIRGYFPELTADQVREVLMKTAVKTKKKIIIPGTSNQGLMREVAISEGFVNAHAAVQFLLEQKK